MAYIQACFEVELETAEKQMQAEQLATRERIEQETKDKILQLQEEIVATELNEGKNYCRYTYYLVMGSIKNLLSCLLKYKIS